MIYDYVCTKRHVTAKMGGDTNSMIICCECGDLAFRKPEHYQQKIAATIRPL